MSRRPCWVLRLAWCQERVRLERQLSQVWLIRRPRLQVVFELDSGVEPEQPALRVAPGELAGDGLRHPPALGVVGPADQADMLTEARRVRWVDVVEFVSHL